MKVLSWLASAVILIVSGVPGLGKVRREGFIPER
jgi:hypothetical protein